MRAVLSGKHPHPLWLPQVQYLQWADTYDRLYRPDQLAELETDLTRVAGRPVQFERGVHENLAAGKPPVAVAGGDGECYADTPAGELPVDPACWRDLLVDEPLQQAIEDYYAWDLKLYNRSAEQKLEETEA